MKTCRLYSWNVNGLRAVVRKSHFFSFLKQEKPDVLCLQETKAHPDQLGADVKDVNGYQANFHWAQKKGYSGVATYSRPPASRIACGLGLPHYDNEGRVLIHSYPSFTLFNVYFPNGKKNEERLAYKMAFYKDFLQLVNQRMKKGEKNNTASVSPAYRRSKLPFSIILASISSSQPDIPKHPPADNRVPYKLHRV